MTECLNLVCSVAVAAYGAGIGCEACLGAGGSGYALSIGVTERGNVAIYSVAIATRTGVGGIATGGTGSSVFFADVVMYVILSGYGLSIEGELEEVGESTCVGAPVVLGGIPLEVLAGAGVLEVEDAICTVLSLDNPRFLSTRIIKRSISTLLCKKLARKRNEGISTVLVNGNYEDFVVGNVREITCGVINAQIVMGRNLNGRKKLAVRGCADKHEVTGLKLGYESPVANGGSGSNVFLAAVANSVDEVMTERLTNVGVAVHTVSSLGTGCGRPYGVVLLGELFTTAHTFTGLAAKNEPAPVTFCNNVIAFYLTAEGTYRVVFTVGGTGRIDFRLHVPSMNLGVEDFYLFKVAATVSTVYFLKTVGLSLAVSLNENLSFTPEAVSLGINGSCLGVVVIANRTLENGNAGSGTGSSLKLGVEENVLLELVLVVVFTALTLTFNEVMLVRNVVGINLTALANAVNETVLVRGNVVGIGLAALANAVNEAVLVRGNVVGIGLTANGERAVFNGVAESLTFGYAALTGSGGGTGCFTEYVLVCVSTGKHFKNFVEAGNTRELLTGGEAHHKYCNDKHEKCQRLKILHF